MVSVSVRDEVPPATGKHTLEFIDRKIKIRLFLQAVYDERHRSMVSQRLKDRICRIERILSSIIENDEERPVRHWSPLADEIGELLHGNRLIPCRFERV